MLVGIWRSIRLTDERQLKQTLSTDRLWLMLSGDADGSMCSFGGLARYYVTYTAAPQDRVTLPEAAEVYWIHRRTGC